MLRRDPGALSIAFSAEQMSASTGQLSRRAQGLRRLEQRVRGDGGDGFIRTITPVDAVVVFLYALPCSQGGLNPVSEVSVFIEIFLKSS
jgi:hypothetical protein